MDEGMTAREDLGYQKNIPAKRKVFHLNREMKISNEQDNLPSNSDVCRIRFKHGLYAGDVKRIAWEYAEPLIKSRRCEFIEWVR
jgi:hypothetical protein